ncbi:ribonuclease H-like domain-containing protein [Halomontanus rarus]|uniref:ribonuclease H-like domain-containing protein n=1 Tax=Halomontanus rarus TaxID=3034020 RepID=UPI0023E84F48|nr:ribonuclease H-like domain-containing protein [Halovivax sp. TS33]
MIQILAVSDWRSQPIDDLYTILETVEPTPDLLLYAGDDLSRFKPPNTDTDHLAELARLTKHQQSLYVRGNDDPPPPIGPQFNTEYTTDLHTTPYTHENLVFIGQEGSTQGPGLITYTEDEVHRHLSEQRTACEDRTPILVTHTSPFGILDIGKRFGQQHIGSKAVRTFINDHQPPLIVCGHCHQFGGRAETLEYGTVINIASHDGPDDPGRYALITIDTSNKLPECDFYDTRDLIGSRLTDLVQVGRNRVKQFGKLGITSSDEITEERRAELEALPGSSSWHVDRWIAHRQAFDNEEVVVLNKSAFDMLHEANPLLLDIETDLQQARIWLVGTYSYQNDAYRQFFDPDDESTLLHELSEYLDRHRSEPIIYYGGNNFDEQCLEQRFEEHGITKGVKHLERAYDLGITAQQELFGPFDRHKLDVVANALGFEYQDPTVDGFEAGSRYTRYLLDGKEPDWNRLKQYNTDDITALRTIVDYIKS